MNHIKKPKFKFGQILVASRRSKNLSLNAISKKLQIPFKYLEALEYNDFNNLPGQSKWKKFLKEYCVYLGLNFKEIYQTAKSDFKKTVGAHHNIEKSYLRSWPKAIRAIIIVAVLAGVLIFLGFKVNQIFSAPPLQILQPIDSTKTYNKQLTIVGKSRKEAEIFINNNPIFVDGTGKFETTIDLQNGLNLIKITAKKKYSRTREVNLRVLLSESGS